MQTTDSTFDRDSWNNAYIEAGVPSGFEPEGLVLSAVEKLLPGTALDLGCGVGVNSIYLAEQGWQVTGVDWAEAAIKQARARARSKGLHARFVVADAAEWKPHGQFDLVLSTYALPPAGPQRQGVMETAAEAVAPGGTLLLIEWDRLMADAGFWKESDLVSTDELVGNLHGLVVDRAELVEVDFAKHRANESSSGHDHEPAENKRPDGHVGQPTGKWFAALVSAHRTASG